jgi:hypothetical protein
VADGGGAVEGNAGVEVFRVAVGGGERGSGSHPDLRRTRGGARDREYAADELTAVLLGFERLERDLLPAAGDDGEIHRVLLRADVEIGVVDDHGHRIVKTEAADGFEQEDALAVRGVGVVEERGADLAVVEGDGELPFMAVPPGGGRFRVLIADADPVAGQHFELLVFAQRQVILRHRHEGFAFAIREGDLVDRGRDPFEAQDDQADHAGAGVLAELHVEAARRPSV